MKTTKMTVEIWSDVTCPFCYIGKRNFESALVKFSDAASIEITWKSFELAPGFKTMPDKNVHQFLAALKGISLEQSIAMSDQVAGAAREVGLEFNFHKAIPANSFNAHRILQLAKRHNLKDEVKEGLYKAYFTDGKNIDDLSILMQVGKEAGLPVAELKSVLEGHEHTDEVNRDIAEAKQRGITSVPAFVFNKKQMVSGAQDSSVFLKILEKTFSAWKIENPEEDDITMDGKSCEIDGAC